MDDLSLIRAARTKTTGPTDAATAAARAKLAARMERPTRFSFRPRFSPLVISITTVAAVAVIATIAFTAFGMGVKNINNPAVVPTQSASPTPDPTGTAAPAVWSSPPVIAFGDDCDSVFTTDQVAGFFDTPDARLVDPNVWGDRVFPTRAVIPHNGGLWCMWNDTTTDDGTASGSAPWMIAVVLPATALPGVTDFSSCDAGNNFNSCDFAVVSNGYVLTGTMGRGSRDETTVTDVAVPALADAFGDSTANAGPAPAAYSTRAGDWPSSVDCAALFTDAQVWESFGEEPLPATELEQDSTPSAIDDDIVHGHGLTACSSGDYGNIMGVNVLPGGSWLEDSVAAFADVEKITIPGADSAYLLFSQGEEGHSWTVWAFDGPNLLTVSGQTDHSAKSPVEGLLTVLDGGAIDTPDPSAVITTGGYGDLKLGAPVPADTKLVEWIDDDECADNGGYFNLVSNEGSILVRTVNGSRTGKIEAISIYNTDKIMTKSGAHVGMSRAELEAMFPKAKVLMDGVLYVVSDSLGQVVFDVGAGGDPNEDKVVLIHVLLPTTTPFSAQNSGFGPCI